MKYMIPNALVIAGWGISCTDSSSPEEESIKALASIICFIGTMICLHINFACRGRL